MAELITTEAEKAAASYLDWSDDAVGKFAKHLALTLERLKDDSEGLHKITSASCAMLLVGAACEANADTLKLEMTRSYGANATSVEPGPLPHQGVE